MESDMIVRRWLLLNTDASCLNKVALLSSELADSLWSASKYP